MAMTFLWFDMLWLLALLPVLVAAYVLLLRRTRAAAVRYSNLDLVRAAIGPGQKIRRHVPPFLLLLALALLALAIARPSATITLPSQNQTIMLAIDVSLSMRAADVDPNRITAAQVAARSFIQEQPPNLKIGLVAFGGTATVVQRPTRDKDELIAAIDRFELQRGTATGSALMVALQALFPEDPDLDLESMIFGGGSSSRWARSAPIDAPVAPRAEKKPFKPVPPGSNSSAAVILLSDGRRTTGPDPAEVAKLAADRGIRVYTVGFGTAQGASVDFGGWSIYMRLDEEALKAVAHITQAEYFHAASADELKKVYQHLNAKFVLEKKETELTAVFSGAGVLVALLALLLSVAWFNRPRVA